MKSALEQSVQVFCDKTAAALLPLIDADIPLEVKASALLVLSKVRNQAAKEKIREFYDNHPNLEEAIIALAETGGDDIVEILIGAVRNPKSKHRDIIADQLGSFNNPGVHECLKQLLGDEDRQVRFQAANSLFRIGGRDSALALCRFISDPDEWISMSILRILCMMKEHESIPYLAEQFSKDNDLRRKALMVSFLARFKSVTLVNIFDEGLRGRDARLKANSIEAVGELELPRREITSRISPYLKDPNNRIRANAILALARSEPETIKPEIIQMALSDDVQLRRSAAFILGMIGISGSQELAEKLVLDNSDDVRKRMVLSLKKFPADFSCKLLEKSVQDPNKWIRKYSIDMAAKFPEFPVQIILRQLKNETAYPNIVACMDFFATRSNDEAVRLIKNRVKDKREPVVSAVIRAIAGMQGLHGLQNIASQIDYKHPLIFRTFVETHFALGGTDILDSTLDKVRNVRKGSNVDMYFPALIGCLNILNKGEKMPPNLLAALSRITPSQTLSTSAKIAMPVQPETKPDLNRETAFEPDQSAQSEDLFEQMQNEIAAIESETEKPIPESEKSRSSGSDFNSAVKLFNLGKHKKAEKIFQEIASANPEMFKTDYYLGMIAYARKDYAEAVKFLTRFLSNSPENSKTIQILGKVFKNLRDWPNAIKMYEKMISEKFGLADKARAKAMTELGISYIFASSYEKARSVLEKVFQLDPSNFENNYYLAMSYFRLENYSKAENLLLDIVKLLPPTEKFKLMAESMLEKIRVKLGENVSKQNHGVSANHPGDMKSPKLNLNGSSDGNDGSPAGDRNGSSDEPDRGRNFLDLSELEKDPLKFDLSGSDDIFEDSPAEPDPDKNNDRG